MRINILFIALVVFVSGCYPGGAEFVEELDAVYTNYDPDFNFDQTFTYSLPPGVLDLDGQGFSGNTEYIDEVFGDAILDDVRENLNALGWTEVTAVQNPDLIILASAASTTTLYYYDFGYWGGYYPGYAPGWGWFYPGYSPGYVSGYTTGTVLLQMTEPGGITGNEVPVVWTGALNGLLQGSDANIVSRIDTNIDLAFSHDPFN